MNQLCCIRRLEGRQNTTISHPPALPRHYCWRRRRWVHPHFSTLSLYCVHTRAGWSPRTCCPPTMTRRHKHEQQILADRAACYNIIFFQKFNNPPPGDRRPCARSLRSENNGEIKQNSISLSVILFYQVDYCFIGCIELIRRRHGWDGNHSSTRHLLGLSSLHFNIP